MTAAHVSCPSHVGSAPQRGLWNRPVLLLTLAASLWASNFVLGRAVPTSLAPVSLSFWRWVIAAVLAFPMALPHLRQDLPALRRGWPMLLLLSALGLAGSNTLAYFALRLTDATSALLVQSAIPATIVAFGFLLFRDRIRMDQVTGLILALGGVLCIVLAKPSASGALNAGTALAVVAMTLQALYATMLRHRPPVHPTSFLFLIFASAALLMLPFQLAFGTPLPLSQPGAMAALSYLALGPSVLAFFLFNRGVALIGSGAAGLFFYLMPVFVSAFAAIGLGERIGAIELVGFALVGIGFAHSRRGRAQTHPAGVS